MQEYLSKTERIQNHIKEILADEQKHSTKEIIEYVDSKLKQNGMFVFQINSYVNAAMRLLMASGDYAKVAYGVYQKGGIQDAAMKENPTPAMCGMMKVSVLLLHILILENKYK